ncbi:hypothetical protein HanLR1_Chr00c0401g0748871 [Helianthus annuus]|nr:hypothetical protein HanHA89_Chr17g0697671 [Helianthus annuus]KAJ0817888.1 hypothetical protein HanLR1_Chr00c0401g0748871 [Helianthus annuus]
MLINGLKLPIHTFCIDFSKALASFTPTGETKLEPMFVPFSCHIHCFDRSKLS